MRKTFLLIALLVANMASAQKKEFIFSAGLDYRDYPIDIEDVPIGGSLQSSFGHLTHDRFWQTISIHGRVGVKTKRNWLLSVAGYSRYNGNHYLEDPYSPSGPTTAEFNPDTKAKSKVKFDLFLDVEKNIKISKAEEKYLTMLAGLGFTNINSGADLFYQENIPGGQSALERYKGSYLHFGPRFSFGYQFKKLKGTLDAYFIEDPFQTNLTSLWLGATISYEFLLSKKEKNSINSRKVPIIYSPFKSDSSNFSQDSTINKPIYFKAFAGWKQDGHRLNGKALKTELYKVPEAIPYYKKSIKRNVISLGLLAPTVVFAFLGKTNLDITSPSYGNDKSGFSAVAVGTGIASIFFLASSIRQMKKAVRLYNKKQTIIY